MPGHKLQWRLVFGSQTKINTHHKAIKTQVNEVPYQISRERKNIFFPQTEHMKSDIRFVVLAEHVSNVVEMIWKWHASQKLHSLTNTCYSWIR